MYLQQPYTKEQVKQLVINRSIDIAMTGTCTILTTVYLSNFLMTKQPVIIGIALTYLILCFLAVSYGTLVSCVLGLHSLKKLDSKGFNELCYIANTADEINGYKKLKGETSTDLKLTPLVCSWLNSNHTLRFRDTRYLTDLALKATQ